MTMDFRDALKFAGAVLTKKAQQPGGINAKTSALEDALIIVQAFMDTDKTKSTQAVHRDALVFSHVLAGDFQAAVQQMVSATQLMNEQTFENFCQRFVDFSGSIDNPEERKRAMMLFGMMMASRTPLADLASQQTQDAPQARPNQPRPAWAMLDGPAHPNAPLFRPYLAKGVKEGGAAIAADFERLSQERARDFFSAFIDYAVTLRGEGELRTAFALSNKLYTIFLRMRSSGDNIIRLPSKKEA